MEEASGVGLNRVEPGGVESTWVVFTSGSSGDWFDIAWINHHD